MAVIQCLNSHVKIQNFIENKPYNKNRTKDIAQIGEGVQSVVPLTKEL